MYTFITQHTSPNFTPAAEAMATWGRPRTIEKIAIHWWDDPAKNPSFEGVISGLCNPSRGASAHFVATGTDRRVACLVELADASWATNNANPYTISIECDPRCRDEDYDVVGELVAELRATYGNLPLIGHRDVVNTRCPGNYDLARIDAVASTKIARAEDQFGQAKNKDITPPTPAPVVKPTPLSVPLELTAVVDAPLVAIPSGTQLATINKGAGFRAYAVLAANNKTYYITEYSYFKGLNNGVDKEQLVAKTTTPPVVTPPATNNLESRVATLENFNKRLKEL